MPYTLPINSIAQVNMEYTLNGETCINTFHYRLIVGVSVNGALELLSLANVFDGGVWTAALSPIMSVDAMDMHITAQAIFSTRYRKQDLTSITPAGSVIGASAPSGVSVVVRRQGDLADRHNQGRIDVAGIPLSSILESELTPARLAVWQGALGGLLNQNLDDGTFTWEPTIFSLRAPASQAQVQTVTVDPVLRYQRRREIGKGV
jgi:hypothetical protein